MMENTSISFKPRKIIKAIVSDLKTPDHLQVILKKSLNKSKSHQALLLTANYFPSTFQKSMQ